MEGDAIARWVRRHPQAERFRAALTASDIALEQAIAKVRAADPHASARDVRDFILRTKRRP